MDGAAPLVLPTIVEPIETETKPALGAAFLNCSVAFEENAEHQVSLFIIFHPASTHLFDLPIFSMIVFRLF